MAIIDGMGQDPEVKLGRGGWFLLALVVLLLFYILR
jgi:hypothetical protein